MASRSDFDVRYFNERCSAGINMIDLAEAYAKGDSEREM